MILIGGGEVMLRPAQLYEGLLKTRERQAHHVEVTTLNAGNITGGVALDGIAAGLVVRLAGAEVAGDFFLRERSELHKSGLDKREAFGVGEADERDSGENGVRAAGKFFEHAAGVVGRTRLSKDVAVEHHLGVSGNKDSRTHRARGGELAFGISEAEDQVLRRFVRIRRLVNGRRKHSEMVARVAKNLGAAGGSGSKNQFHNVPYQTRILQCRRDGSLRNRKATWMPKRCTTQNT